MADSTTSEKTDPCRAARVIVWMSGTQIRGVLADGVLYAETYYVEHLQHAGLPPIDDLDWLGIVDVRASRPDPS
jgi:hypothetical protein